MTLEDIKKQISLLGNDLDTFGTKKEIKFLPEVLHDDEVIQYLTSGLWEGNTWLVVCTQKRVIFLDKGMFFGLKQQEIPLNRITSVSQKQGLILGEIGISEGSRTIVITNILKKTIKPFVDILNRSIETFKGQSNTVSAVKEDPIAQIERLAKLQEQGILSEEEFSKKKEELLASL